MMCAGTFRRALAALASLMLVSNAALAQDDPEAGDFGGGVDAEADAAATWSPPGGSAGGSASSSGGSGSDDSSGGGGNVASGDTDHSQFVGRLGVGWFGVQNVPSCHQTGCAGGSAADNLRVPTIGARYWLDGSMGVQAALGFNMSSGSVDNTVPNGMGSTTTTVEDPSMVGLALHGGFILVLADTQHVTFEAIPQLNIGFATGSAPNGAMQPDTEFGGFLLEMGGTVGAEVHFGFIGLPSLALQGNVGVMLSHRSASVDQGGNASTEVSQFTFMTDFNNAPWDIFTGGVTAIYYL